ncbi:hypothetical protein Tco_1289693 [Tanacetum coccineum]
MPIFKRTFSQDLNLLEQHLTKDILSQTDCSTTLTKLRTKFKNAFNSEFKERMQKYTRFNAQSFLDAMICNMDSIGKYMLEIILHQQRTSQLLTQKKLMQTQEDHSNIVLSKEDLKGTRIEHGFKRAFMLLFGRDNETFTSMMLLNVDQLQKQLDKDEFQEDRSLAAFWKSVAERTRHQRQYDRRLNKRQMQTQESKIDTDIRPIYDEEPMVEVQLTAKHTEQLEISHEGQHGQILNETSNKAKIKKEIDVLETMNIELEHSVAKLRKENKSLKNNYKDLYDSIKIIRSKTIERTTSLLANNADLKAQIQEKVFAIAALKNDLRKLKGNSIDTKFAKTTVLGKPVLQSLRNQSVVRQPNAFKSKRPQMSKKWFASQVDVNNNLSRPVT